MPNAQFNHELFCDHWSQEKYLLFMEFFLWLLFSSIMQMCRPPIILETGTMFNINGAQ